MTGWVVSNTGGTVIRHFYYSSAWRVLEERVGSDPTSASAERQYVWGDRYLDELVERDRDTNGDGTLNERLYALQDANFDVTAIADASGNIVERYSYTPYGSRTVLDASTWAEKANNASGYDWTVGHQGLAQDDLTGLINDRCRFLHPGLGRFIGRDPLSYVDGMNLYEYEIGNPWRGFDPYGASFWGTVWDDTVWTGHFVAAVPGAYVDTALDGSQFDAVQGFFFGSPNGQAYYGHQDAYAGGIISRDGAIAVDTGIVAVATANPEIAGAGAAADAEVVNNAEEAAQEAAEAEQEAANAANKLGDRNYPEDPTKGEPPENPNSRGGKKLPNDRIKSPPTERGKPPTGDDGNPVELHHRNQQPDDPLDEMTRNDHRGPGNYSKNHPNTGQQPSQIDRRLFNKERTDYWNWEWDNGRWDEW